MKNYEFRTTTTMKENNREKWWIDSDIIRPIIISAENLKAAMEKYRKYAYDTAYVEISGNAIRTKNAMYVDTKEGAKQVGYVITGKSEFQDDRNYRWSTQYIDLWVNISEICDIDFEMEWAENNDN